MKKPELVIMAAGMGSRYGGLKQIDPIDEYGSFIIDYSVYDAVRAGFETVNFIINRKNEQDFKDAIGKRIENRVKVRYIYQDLDNIPKGIEIPEGRVKPWGTGHAILSCKGIVDAPFMVINSDDYYGAGSFKMAYDFLSSGSDKDKYRYAMVGYKIENTLSDKGSVARGLCETDENGYLKNVVEHTKIMRNESGKIISELENGDKVELKEGMIVSMNLWCFTPSILNELENGFEAFLKEKLAGNPLKCEYFLPSVVDRLIKEGKAEASVLTTDDKWYGVTYHEDKQLVMDAFKAMREKGLYPKQLWS